MIDDPLDNCSIEMLRHQADTDGLFDMLFTIHSNYVALQHGMTLDGVIDGDLRNLVSKYNLSQFSFEELNAMCPAEQYRNYIESTQYGFALESFLEGLLDRSIVFQALFICLFPAGIVIWCLAIIDRIYQESQTISEERKKLQEQGFFSPDANPSNYASEALDGKSLPRYQKSSVKAYPAKQMLEELEASYALMRIFTDAANNGTLVKMRQILPSIKKLGYIVDENRGKIKRDPAKTARKGTMTELGYGDPNFIKQLFIKTNPHTDILPVFHKAMEKIKKEQEDQNGVLAKLQNFFRVKSKEEVKAQDKVTALLIGEALKATLTETEILFRMTISLMAVVHKFD